MSGSYYALDAAYNSLQTQLSSLNAQVVYLQSTINNLTYVNQALSVVSVPAGSTTASVPFGQSLTLPSSGTWLITGNFSVVYQITSPAVSVTTEGFFVSGFGALQYTDFGVSTANAVPTGLGFLKNFSVSGLYNTATAGLVLFGSGGVVGSPYGTTFQGNVSAVKISTL